MEESLPDGTLNSDYAAIWQQGTPAEFLRFDGTNDELNFGDVLDDDASADFVIECWVRVQGADASLQEIFAKKSAYGDNTAGYALVRTTGNKIAFKVAGGASNAEVVTSASLLQNVWKHVAVTIDRNGNMQTYLNGVADGTPVSVSAIPTAQNALNLYAGRDGTNYGQVDTGDVRVFTFGAGGLPSDIATTLLDHYNAEKSFYGL